MEKVSESINYNCEKCNYITNVKSNYIKHCLTAKHKNVINVIKCNEKVSEGNLSFSCRNCDKVYKSNVGLWRHSKICSPDKNKNMVVENPTIDTSLIIKLIHQNETLQNLLVQQASDYAQKQSELVNKFIDREPVNNITNNNNNNNNTTNNINKFNLNFFLNETCKDAMSIQEFLENIRITFDDLLNIGNDGFVTGVSDILIKQLRDLDVSKRPIHCTDSKRETIYLKENAAWNKDDKDKTKLKQMIEKIEYRNVVALRDCCNENPDARVNNTPNNLLKDKIYLQTLQGDNETRDKIIKNISKEVIVDKE